MRVLPSAMEGVRVTFTNRALMLVRVAAFSALALSRQPATFSHDEAWRIAKFWHTKGRFVVTAPPESTTRGPWQVRLSREGSAWLAAYNSARGAGKNAVARPDLPSWDVRKEWAHWLDGRVAYDRFVAGKGVAEANSRYLGHAVENPMPLAADPGPEPDSLKRFVGVPPSFAAAVVPNLYRVEFADGTLIKMADNPPMQPNFEAYRFPQGVMSSGTALRNMPPEEINSLFAEAGIDGSERKVMKAVSMLEGGFDSVNTYDSGYVSVGLIQFACLSKGSGSLGKVLLREKMERPEAFEEDFHRYGLDVTDQGNLVALDVETGEVYEGANAAKQIINDKRLVAVFQHAGLCSRAFRIAQLEVAKEQYYPSQDSIAVNLDGQVVKCRVCDVIKSEAGMATLMDRKVNTGNINPLPFVLARICSKEGCTSVEDLAAHESDVVAAMKFRKDYTEDAELSQPGEITAAPRDPRSQPLSSRHGHRFDRRKKR